MMTPSGGLWMNR